jgi:hypothetical protein
MLPRRVMAEEIAAERAHQAASATASRLHISRYHSWHETRLAAALLALGAVPYDDAKAMGETNFLSLFAFDHNIRHAEDGTDDFWNLAPMLIPAHRKKTAEIDVPSIAKTKRLAKARAALQLFLATGEKPPIPGRRKRKIPQPVNPWPAKGSRKLRSRGFERRVP